MDKMLEWILEMCKKGHVATPDDFERFFRESANDEAETEKEAHILTREELEDWNDYVWVEYREHAIMQVALFTYGIQLYTEFGKGTHITSIDQLKWDVYEKRWRCWSDKPTIEQRRTAWKE